VTFKSRVRHSKAFWPDALWWLYRSQHRCMQCREAATHAARPEDLKVQCPHMTPGCPAARPAEATRGEHTVERGQPCAGGMGVKRKDSNHGLQRAYPVQIKLGLVWAALGA